MKRKLGLGMVLLFVTTLFAGVAWAEEPAYDPGTGIVYVKLSAEYAIPFKEGERYEEHEFYKGGKQLVIEGCMREGEYTFELHPMDEAKYENFTIQVTPSCWALKKVKGKRRVKEWRCDLKAKFAKKKAAPSKPVEPEPTPGDPGIDPDVPPMPGVPPPPPPKPLDE